MTEGVFPALTRQGLTEAVEQAIRRAILEGRLAAGERLVEARISEELGVSRAPVREALARDYFVQGQPRVDETVFLVGVDPNVALLRLQRGEVDILGDGIPPARFAGILQDPRWRKQVEVGDQLHTGYVTLHVRTRPLNDVRVRGALNMAVNKERIVRIINQQPRGARSPNPATPHARPRPVLPRVRVQPTRRGAS